MFKPHSLWTIDDTDEINVSSQGIPETAESGKLERAPSPSNPGDEKAEQLKNTAPTDIPLPPPVDATDHAETEDAEPEEDDRAQFASGLAKNTATGDLAPAEPTLGTPTAERSNPISHQPSDEDVTLSKETTASSGEATGPELEREETNANADAIPVSKQTTASTTSGAPLARSITAEQPPEEPRAKVMTEGEPGKASAEQV
jgi:hypothetical protein